MTQYGCEDGCPTCAGFACAACVALDPSLSIASNCPHTDMVEKHRGMRALEMPEPSRVPTKPMPPINMDDEYVIHVDDPESLANALEQIARRVRLRGKVTIK